MSHPGVNNQAPAWRQVNPGQNPLLPCLIFLGERTHLDTSIKLESMGDHTKTVLWVQPEQVAEGTVEGTEDPPHQGTISNRDPKGMNKCLKVTFDDVIAEPPPVRSFDRVWLWSHALFEVSRLWFYRLVCLLLAVPVSLLAGILLAVCLLSRLITPSVQLAFTNMHWVKVAWGSVLDITVSPICRSAGTCCGATSIRLAHC
uniref:Caveolin n=1 Tax=Denticeps clupeoides TaxID=299321 RepID=A0AAY4CL07_9TELE